LSGKVVEVGDEDDDLDRIEKVQMDRDRLTKELENANLDIAGAEGQKLDAERERDRLAGLFNQWKERADQVIGERDLARARAEILKEAADNFEAACSKAERRASELQAEVEKFTKAYALQSVMSDRLLHRAEAAEQKVAAFAQAFRADAEGTLWDLARLAWIEEEKAKKTSAAKKPETDG